MTTVRVTVDRAAATAVLVGIRRMGENLGPGLRRVVARFRSNVRQEFDSSTATLGAGGKVSWKAVGAFGRRPPPSRPLVRTGALMRAWTGEGPGAVESYTDRAATFGVVGFPHARVHRGSSAIRVSAAESRSVTRIPVTRKSRIFVGLNFGVWFRSSRRFVEVPARSHASWNPVVQAEATAIIASHVTGRPTAFGA